MYVGGVQKRPDAPYARPVISAKGQVIGQVGEGNRKDIRDSVEACSTPLPCNSRSCVISIEEREIARWSRGEPLGQRVLAE